MSLIVTGTIGIDNVETARQSVKGVLGGSCAYFAAAASFHTPVRIVAAVGGDWPAAHRQVLERFRGVDLRGLEIRRDSKTFAWGGRYHHHMNDRDTLYTQLGVLEESPPAVPAPFRDSQYIFLANTHPQVQLDLLSQFPERKLAVADSMDLWIKIAGDPLRQLLGKLDGFFANNSEAEQLTGEQNVITAGRKILDMGPSFVVIKKGEHGAILLHDDEVAVVPAFPAAVHQVIDPTGAGDSFAGGMMGHIAAQNRIDFQTIQTAMAWATVTASFTIESFSLDRLASITRADIDERMRYFQRVTRVG